MGSSVRAPAISDANTFPKQVFWAYLSVEPVVIDYPHHEPTVVPEGGVHEVRWYWHSDGRRG